MKKILFALLLFVPLFAATSHAQNRMFPMIVDPAEANDTLGNQGDLFYIDSVNHNWLTRRAIGASGQVLWSNGIIPSWRTNTITVRQSADTSTTGQTLLGTQLLFAVGANQTWAFHVVILDSSSSAAGIKFGYAIPTSATITTVGSGQDTTVLQHISDNIIAGATAGTAVSCAQTATPYADYKADGTVTTGSTAGNVVVEFLKATSGTAIVKAGSYIIAWRIS
jgi:hypothetical protein